MSHRNPSTVSMTLSAPLGSANSRVITTCNGQYGPVDAEIFFSGNDNFLWPQWSLSFYKRVARIPELNTEARRTEDSMRFCPIIQAPTGLRR